MFVTIIYMVYIWPDNQYHAHSHCIPDILRRGNQITIETVSKQESDCTQRFIKDKYTLYINKSYFTSEVSKCL